VPSGRADAAPGHSLFDMIVDDVRAGTVRAYTGLDIVLSGMIHPESPKLIKMWVSGLLCNATQHKRIIVTPCRVMQVAGTNGH